MSNILTVFHAAIDELLAKDVSEIARIIDGTEDDARFVMDRMREWRDKGLSPFQIIAGFKERLMASASGQSASVN